MEPQAAATPKPPYYCVIFTSLRKKDAIDEYGDASERMHALARTMPGYLGIESARGEDGVGITVSYWESEEAIKNWREHAEHLVVQRIGRERFYEWYESRVGKVERAVSFRSET
ncbi:MAG TPA: antibiotic biosynthesis monooxygenase [Candidatus Krumholzibacteria bacterium]|nr:antibiotic biosynthesis monooxygenase [Candidatus Krumholzibacteria bacterium]